MKKLFATVTIGFIAMSAWSAPLSPEAALARINQDGPSGKPTLQNHKLIETFKDKLGLPSLYLFKTQSGFMLISGDDKVIPLLGYGDSSVTLDSENIPPQMKAWIDNCNHQIDFIRSNNIESIKSSELDNDWAPISPLTKTNWDQTSPYNNLCPLYQGSPMPTGCVGTALAQAMKYHNYPQIGKGSITYDPRQLDNSSVIKYNLSMDFSEKPFDWDNMLDTYEPGKYNDIQAEAVAYLMKACAFASETVFGPSSSGALTTNQANALVEFFDYDPSINYIQRDYYTYDDWAKIIYDNLAKNQPVIYGGRGQFGGGHSFICDGYDSDGYFHFNWGWSGIGDGYFILNLLNPRMQGTGGNIYGFTFLQDAIVNIKPSENGMSQAPAKIVDQFGNLFGEIEGNNLNLGLTNETPWGLGWGNLFYKPIRFSLGVLVESENLENFKPETIQSLNYVELDVKPYETYPYKYQDSTYPVIIDLSGLNLQNGSYKVTLVSKDLDFENSEWLPVKTQIGYFNNIVLNKSDEGYSVTNSPILDFTIQSIEVSNPEFRLDEEITVTAVVANNSDVQLTRSVGPCAFSLDEVYSFVSECDLVTINPHETKEFTWTTSLMSSGNVIPSLPLDIIVSLYNSETGWSYYGEEAEATILPIINAPELSVNLEIEDANQKDDIWVVSDPLEMKINFTLKLEKGSFSYPVSVEINEEGYMSSLFNPLYYQTYPRDIKLAQGLPLSYDMTLNFANWEEGKNYTMNLAFLNSYVFRLDPVITFTIGETGINNIVSENDDIKIIKSSENNLHVSSATILNEVSVVKADGTVIYSNDNISNNELDIYIGNASGVIMVKATDSKGNIKTYKTVIN